MNKISTLRLLLATGVAGMAFTSAAYAAEAETKTDGDIVVVAIKQQYRGDVSVKELPQSVSVMSNELLTTVGITQLDAALDLASGVNRQNNFGGIWDAFSIRGFAGDENLPGGVLVNGFNAGRGFGGPRDASNIDHIEVLKGPSSALFGRGEPGGTVNVVTKKPLFETKGSMTLSGGSYDTKRVEGDFTTPLSDAIAVRINGAYQDAGSFRDIADTTRFTVTPSILIKLTPDTVLSYELEYVDLKTPFDRGVIAIDGQLGLVPRSRFFGEPGDGRNHVTALGHQVQLQQNLGNGWSALLGFGYRDTSFSGFSSDAEITPARQQLYSGGTNMSRQRRYRDYDTKNTVVRGEVSGKFYTGSIKHHVLFGADYDSFDIDQVQLRYRAGKVSAVQTQSSGNWIDVMDPVYGQLKTPGAFRDTLEKQRGWGVYFQDQIDLTDAFKLRIGGRYDEFRPETMFRAGDFNVAAGSTGKAKYTKFSPQAGVVYELSPMFSLYASYGKGFRPNSGTDVNSKTFEPEQTRSYEVGAKFSTADEKLNGTIALFDIKKNNVLTADPNNAGFSLALGSAKSKGIEFDLNGELPAGFRLWLSYAYLDAQSDVDAGDPNGFGFLIHKGDPLLNIPKHSGNLLLTKEIEIGNDKLMIGGGVNYVSKRLGETGIQSFQLPDYTLVKLISSYTFSDHFKVSGEVNNLFNTTYYPSSYARLWVTPGTPRTFTLRGTVSF